MKYLNINEALKDNYLALTTIPLFLASGWQVFSLSLIGAPYIRFFSTTQLIADAAIILSFIFVMFLTFLLIKFSIERDKKSVSDRSKKLFGDSEESDGAVKSEKNNTLSRVLPSVLAFILLSTTLILVFFFIWPILEAEKETKTFSGYMIIIFIIMYAVMNVIKSDAYKKPVIRGFVNLMVVGIVFYTFINFNSLFASFTNLENTNNFCNPNKCKVRYFNDKFIFIEKYNNDTSTIKILKFDEFFKKIPEKN